jgi:hypothetical protein
MPRDLPTGYGLKNLYRGDKADGDLPARLRRNFCLRNTVEDTVNELSLPDLFRHMKYIFDRTFEPLLTAGWIYLKSDAREGSTSLSCLQWRALVRFLWLRDLYEARLATFSQGSESFLDGCKEMLDKMKVQKITDFSILLSVNVYDCDHQKVGEAVLEELVENTLFRMRARLRLPFDNSLWCGVGSRLVETLCRQTATISCRKELYDAFLESAESSIDVISECVRQGGASLNDLAFGPGTLCKSLAYEVVDRAAKSCKGFSVHSHIGHDITPKALLAAMAAVMNEQGKSQTTETSQDFRLGTKRGFVVLELHRFDGESKLNPLASVVGSLSCVHNANGGRQVNGLWYKVWQVVYVVHAFALTFIPERADEIVHALSTSLTLEPCIIQFAIARTIRSERNEPVDILLEEAKRVAWEDFKSQVSSSRVEKRKRTEIEHQRALLEKQKYFAAERKKARERVHSVVSDLERTKKRRAEERSVFWGTSVPREGKETKTKSHHPKSDRSEQKRLRPAEVYFGPPTRQLDYPGGWPKGWTQKTFKRASGASVRQTDDYFYSPQLKLKIRSISQVLHFLKALEARNGDELAMKSFKSR